MGPLEAEVDGWVEGALLTVDLKCFASNPQPFPCDVLFELDPVVGMSFAAALVVLMTLLYLLARRSSG